jgi:3',5'-cyclic AMP phosphodiesterase CpdA
MTAHRIIQISDTHLWARGGPMANNFRRVAGLLNRRTDVELVVHTGDVAALTPDSDADRRAASELLGTIDAPLAVLPGNHDVGGLPGRPWMGLEVTSRRLASYRSTFGADRWLHLLDADWALLGINSQLVGSGLPEEQDQREWLRSVIAQVGGRRVVLFLHKPLWWPSEEHPPDHPELGITDGPRAALLEALQGFDLKAVSCGHLHRYRLRDRVRENGSAPGTVLEILAPATGLLARGPHLPPAQESLGGVELMLNSAGVEARFLTVPGLIELDPEDIPEVRAVIDGLASHRNGATADDAGCR